MYTASNYGPELNKKKRKDKDKGRVLSTKVPADDYPVYTVLAKYLVSDGFSYGKKSKLIKIALDEFLYRRGINNRRFMQNKEIIDEDGSYDKEYAEFLINRPLSPFHIKRVLNSPHIDHKLNLNH